MRVISQWSSLIKYLLFSDRSGHRLGPSVLVVVVGEQNTKDYTSDDYRDLAISFVDGL